MTSSAFERFRFSFFEDRDSVRSGLDIGALQSLEGEERDRAEEMLLNYLPDTRGVIGLGELRTTRAEPAIAEMLEATEGSDSKHAIPYLAKALWQIRPDACWLNAMRRVLVSGNEIERANAARAFKAFHDSAAVSVLIEALDDPSNLVRHHAGRSVLAIYGLDDYTVHSNGQHVTMRVMSDDPEIREGAKREILASISGKPISAR